MNLKDRIRSFPILDYKLPFNEIFRNETKQDYRTYKQQQQYSKPRQTDISEFFKLIVNDYIDNNSICLFFIKVTTHQKRGEWDSNRYPSNVGSAFKY